MSNLFLGEKDEKIKMVSRGSITLEEGCNKYLDNCRARNLREGTINHYRQTYVQFKKFFDMQMLVSDIDESVYQRYVVFLRETLHNDVSINAYLRDFITTMHFLMREGYDIQSVTRFGFDGCREIFEGRKAQRFISYQIMKRITKELKSKTFRP